MESFQLNAIVTQLRIPIGVAFAAAPVANSGILASPRQTNPSIVISVLSSITSAATLALFPSALPAADATALLSPSAQQSYQPDVKPASQEGEQNIAKQQVPAGFSIKLWAAEPDLANPVAFCFDMLGRVYVAETFRQEYHGVPDNRGHRYWLEDDLRLQTVEERGEMYLKHHPEYAEEYTREHERIRRLVDTDGDGKADQSTVFADGFNDLLDGTGAGVLARGKDVWFTCIPKLWKLSDLDMDGVADHREALHHGYGVRVAFRGHDMHGLIIGPDGKLYFSIGDRGYNVLTKEGSRLVEPGRGAVFRCNLDGTELEVFATGLRNPQELAFDDYGNLFTGDNNCDAGDRARLVYLMEGSDAGWSMNFQYLPDRGPWMSESWWKPRFDGQPAFLNAPLKNMTAGPSGFTHYPGVGLPEKYNDSFFLADFRGGANGSGIVRFNLKADGAGFAVNEEEQFWWKILATDVDFGPDCKLYTLDWVAGWVGPGKGRIYQLNQDDVSQETSALMERTAALLAADLNLLPTSDLLKLLSFPDYRVRLEAQLVLMSRGDGVLGPLSVLAGSPKGGTKARIHAIWALTHLQANELLGIYLNDQDAEVRAQAAKGLGENRNADAAVTLTELLQDSSPRVRYFAAEALGKIAEAKQWSTDGGKRIADKLFDVLRANQNQDRFLRHACAYALGRIARAGGPQLYAHYQSKQDSPIASVRLGAVLGLRFAGGVEVAEFLNDSDPFVAAEAAIAIYDTGLDSAMPQLADHLSRCLPPTSSTSSKPMSFAFTRRALHAANRRGSEQDLENIFRLVFDEGNDIKLREEAAKLAADWSQPQEFDLVRNESRTYGKRDAATTAKHLQDYLPAMLRHNSPAIQLAAIQAVRGNRIGGDKIESQLLALIESNGAKVHVRTAALEALQQQQSPQLGKALAAAGASSEQKLRAQAVRMLAKWQPEEALPILANVLPNAAPPEQAAAFVALADLNSPDADELIAEWVARMAADQVDPSVQLELFECATARAAGGSQLVDASLKKWRQAMDQQDPLAWQNISLHGGDVGAGRDVFYNNATASCQRCHFVETEAHAEMAPEVGPELSSVGLTLSRQELLESILQPTKKIASGFEFYDGDGQLLPISAMTPGLGQALTPRELRDLVAYLDSLKKKTRVMIFVYSAGYEHQVAKADASGLSYVEKCWQQWAEDDPRFEVVISRDPNWFTSKNLADVDAVFFYTTGELPIPEEGKQAFQQFVENGGGFVGAHCATDTFYKWEWYGNMISGYFDGHPWNAHATVGVKVDDPDHCSTEHFPKDGFIITDEIYQMKDPYSRDRQHLLLSLDTEKSDMTLGGIRRTDNDFGISWTRKQGKGRVFYSSLGHRQDVWAHPAYRKHMVEGMLWAAGK